MFKKVLIANRGEIAIRIARTLQRMGIQSVAVYSDADAGALHVRMADESIRLGATAPAESYLSIERILSAAASTGSAAIHPGYGFLAESSLFASACTDAGLTFVGPSAQTIEAMGDKIRAKEIANAAGVATVPGAGVAQMTDDDFVHAAAQLGYPVLVKPSAGGGGKGMHLVSDEAQLLDALSSARRVAKAAFGDDTVFLERLIRRPRHIEVQVMADNYGKTIHFGERECSLQRRHQKIVEESPSVLVDDLMRDALGTAAVKIARSVSYVGAGTVEFIVSADRPEEFFFLEMNPRLQVEHAVTELVAHVDLVELQLRIAAGEPLSIDQVDVQLRGHAIEARLYAEDPARGFLPTSGRVCVLREPVREHIRIDSSLEEGGHVATAYDPMLSKVIAWGHDRSSAMARLDRALSENVLLGVQSNIGFLRELLSMEEVETGAIDTELVERGFENVTVQPPSVDVYAVLALSRLLRLWPAAAVSNRWDIPDGWRTGGERGEMSWEFEDTAKHSVVLGISGDPDAAHVRIGDEPPFAASASLCGHELEGSVGHRRLKAVVCDDDRDIWVWVDGRHHKFREVVRESESRGATGGADTDVLRSPMPGTVIAVRVQPDDEVPRGEVLVIVEAMKMEYALKAAAAGRVDEIYVNVGDKVAADDPLARLTALVEAQ